MISYRIGWERDEMYLFHMQTVLYLSISIAPFNLYQVSAAASQNLSASSQDLPRIRHCNLGLTNRIVVRIEKSLTTSISPTPIPLYSSVIADSTPTTISTVTSPDISRVNLLPLHFFCSSVSAAPMQTLSDGQTISSEAKFQCVRIKCMTNCIYVGMRNSKNL